MSSMDLENNSPEASFHALIEQISANLFKVNNNINNIRKLQTTLNHRYKGGKSSSIDKPQKRIHELVSATNELFREISQPQSQLQKRFVFQNAHSYSDEGFNLYTDVENDSDTVQITKSQSLQKDKILREVVSTLQSFQAAQEVFKEFIKSTELKQLIMEEEEQQSQSQPSTVSPQLQQQNFVKEMDPINNEELVFHTQMITHREQEIENIESSIAELNVIFKDLDSLVVDQGYMVDNIESNIGNYSDNAKSSHRELQQANKHQRRSFRTKKCLMMLCATIIFIFMILVLALT